MTVIRSLLMLSRRPELVRRFARWLLPAAMLAITPKCVLCILAYAGIGAALGVGGPEICGVSSARPFIPVMQISATSHRIVTIPRTGADRAEAIGGTRPLRAQFDFIGTWMTRPVLGFTNNRIGHPGRGDHDRVSNP